MFYRYNFSDVRVLEGVNIKSLSTNDVLCFHFLEGSRPLLRYIGRYCSIVLKTLGMAMIIAGNPRFTTVKRVGKLD